MSRLLVAFEATPSDVTDETYEELWENFISTLHSRGLYIPQDLDPVTVHTTADSTFEVYEAAAL